MELIYEVFENVVLKIENISKASELADEVVGEVFEITEGREVYRDILVKVIGKQSNE